MTRQEYIEIRKNLKTEKKPWSLALYAFQDLFLILGIVFLWKNQGQSWISLSSIPLVTVLMFRNFSQMHDAVHSASNEKRSLNDFVGVICGCLCFLPFEAWKKVHLEHHYWSGNFEKDPVMGIVKNFPKMKTRSQKILNFFWNSWVPLLASLQYGVFWSQSVKQVLKNKNSKKMVLSVVLPLFFWAGLIAFIPLAFVAQILAPAVALYLLFVEVVNFPHHLEFPHQLSNKPTPVWQQHLTARSCIYPRWFSKYVVLNFNFHTEHHLFPDVSWYHLGEIHLVLKEKLQLGYNQDLNFSWVLKNRSKSLNAVFGYDLPRFERNSQPEKVA